MTSVHPPGVKIHPPMGAELVVSNNKLPQTSECSELVVGSLTVSFSIPSSELVVSSYNIPTYIYLELAKKCMIPIQETTQLDT